jgi:sarcosine oxidase subunit alpha
LSSDKVTIRFEGKQLECRAGTSVAVALWENGVRHLSHSHKYGHPRGVTCARSQCTACLMRVDGVPNVRVCELPVAEGMAVQKQDAGTFYAAPMQKMLSVGGNLFPVGFYYKWFTRPATLSRFFLERIRPLTGVGRLPSEASLPELPEAPNENPIELPSTDLGHFDTLVTGAGPSGLQEALGTPGQIMVVDEHEEPGGQRFGALAELSRPGGLDLERFPVLAAAYRRLEALVEQFQAERGSDFRGGLRVIAGYSPNGLVLRDEQSLYTATFGNLVWSAGALDTLGLFPGNDTPGVLGPRALYRLLQRDGLNIEGQRVLVVGSGLDFWLSSALLARKGAQVSLVVTGSGWQSEVSAAVDLGWQLTTGLKLASIHERGEKSVEATFIPGTASPGPADSHLRLQAHFAVVCNRGKPVYDIPYQLGADLTLQQARGGFVPAQTADGRFSGPLNGNYRMTVTGEAAGCLPEEQADPSRKVEAS